MEARRLEPHYPLNPMVLKFLINFLDMDEEKEEEKEDEEGEGKPPIFKAGSICTATPYMLFFTTQAVVHFSISQSRFCSIWPDEDITSTTFYHLVNAKIQC